MRELSFQSLNVSGIIVTYFTLFSFMILTNTANFENTKFRSQFVSIHSLLVFPLTDPQTVCIGTANRLVSGVSIHIFVHTPWF